MSEKQIAAALLAVEREHVAKVRAAIRIPSNRAALALTSPALTQVGVLSMLRREADAVEQLTYDAVIEARKESRASSRLQQTAAVVALLMLMTGKGRRDVEIALRPRMFLSPEALELDAAHASVAARSLASAWGSTTMSAYQRWRGKASAPTPASRTGAGPYRSAGTRAGGYEGVVSEIQKTPAVLEHRVVRVTATEVAQAHNDEARRVYEEMPPDVRAQVEFMWSAINDQRTCEVCAAADGTVSQGGQFPNGPPPAHILCRCVQYPITRQAASLRKAA